MFDVTNLVSNLCRCLGTDGTIGRVVVGGEISRKYGIKLIETTFHFRKDWHLISVGIGARTYSLLR